MDHFTRVSTEDYIVASFTSTECGKQTFERVRGEIKERPLELSKTQANKEKVQTHLTQETENERAPIVLFHCSFT